MICLFRHRDKRSFQPRALIAQRLFLVSESSRTCWLSLFLPSKKDQIKVILCSYVQCYIIICQTVFTDVLICGSLCIVIADLYKQIRYLGRCRPALRNSTHALRPVVSKAFFVVVNVLRIQSFISYMLYVIVTSCTYTLFVCNFRQSLYDVRCVSYDLATRTRILTILDMLPTLVLKQLHSICTFCLYD